MCLDSYFFAKRFSNMLTDKARKIADEAKSKGMRIYDPSYRNGTHPNTSNISFISTCKCRISEEPAAKASFPKAYMQVSRR
jgi:hypothetical protein